MTKEYVELVEHMGKVVAGLITAVRKMGIPRRMFMMLVEEYWDLAESEERLGTQAEPKT